MVLPKRQSRQRSPVAVRRRYIEAEKDTRLEAIEAKGGKIKLNEKFKAIQRGDAVHYFRRDIRNEEE